MINIIAAIDSKKGIGKDNKLIWHISDDLKRFKSLTLNHPIIMGRKTFQSIGKALPQRTNIVITNDPNFTAENVVIVSSIEEAITKAKESEGFEEIYIIGGGQIYKQALDKDLVDRLYLTLVEGDFKADTFFPDYSNFKLVFKENQVVGDYKFSFVILEK
ncbi:MAG: dihydrofolate reductase [Patescibacteria group bacterium]